MDWVQYSDNAKDSSVLRKVLLGAILPDEDLLASERPDGAAGGQKNKNKKNKNKKNKNKKKDKKDKAKKKKKKKKQNP